jgi:hypothetical protein
MRFKLLGCVVLSLAVLAAVGRAEAPAQAQQAPVSGPFAAEVSAAAAEYGVPEELLLAMGYVNTRWESYATPSIDGGWGVMHLVQNESEDTLGEVSRLTGIPADQLRSVRSQNLRGGAALLAANGGGGASHADLDSWYDAVSAVGGGALYANQVYDALGSGATATISDGETVSLQPRSGAGLQEGVLAQTSAGYPGAIWYPADYYNYGDGRLGGTGIDKIVIHVAQGSYASAMNWFQNPAAGTSSHYTVRSADGVVGQSVSEQNTAWHAGNEDYNLTSVGIEHEGFVDDPSWFTDAMYRSSAQLAAYLCDKYGIPVDREHIVGHNEVPGATHTDPGPYWDWDLYLSYVQQYATSDSSTSGMGAGTSQYGLDQYATDQYATDQYSTDQYGAGSGQYGADQYGAGPYQYGAEVGYADSSSGYEQVVDNVDQVTSGRFSASGNWGWSAWSSQRYYWNYRFTLPAAFSDTAVYSFDVPARGSYAVYGWWPSHPDYNPSVPVGIKTAYGWEWLAVDQTRSGGGWVYLGTYDMAAGDGPRVQVSRWTASDGLIVSDAFKLVGR